MSDKYSTSYGIEEVLSASSVFVEQDTSMNTKSAHPRSVVRGIPRLGRKPDGWREVAFGDVLKVVKRPATIDPDHSYQLINVKRNRGGVIPRETKRGSEIKTKTQFYVAAEDFVVSRRQIVHGACGIVPPKLDGALVSNEYSTFVPKKGLCLEFLTCFSHTSHFQKTCFHASVGVVIEKMIFNLDDWLKHRFYLPPLKEQERIVRILAAADRAIERTEDLIAAKRRFKEGLAKKMLSGVLRIRGCSELWTRHRFGNFVSLSKTRFDPRNSQENRPCIELEHISQGDGRLVGMVDSQEQWSTKAVFEREDVLYGKLRPNLRKSYYCEFDGVCSTEIWVLKADPQTCCGAYLAELVQTDRFISAACVATGTKMPRADWNVVSEVPFVLPSVPEQEKIVAMLQAASRQLNLHLKKITKLRQLKEGLMQKLLSSELGVKTG